MITAGEILRKKRESLGRSIAIVSQETKIQKRYIQYIENNDFSQFDSEVFLTGFIKIYSKYLKLDTDKVLALYRRSRPIVQNKKTGKTKTSIVKHLVLNAKTIITSVSILFLLLIFAYIGIQIYKFQSPPVLTITAPLDGTTTDKPSINVTGATQAGAVLEINNTLITIDQNGGFQKEMELNEGSNIITVKARKNSSSTQEAVAVIRVSYNKPTATDTPTQEETKTFTLKLEVKDVNAWVRLDIDGENKLEKVLAPSVNEYPVTSTFSVMTGKVNNTNIYINGEQLAWKTNSTTGVAEITCNITQQVLSCE